MTNLTTLDLDRAAQALAQLPIGHTLDFHPSVESTMPLAHRLAARPDIRSGAVVLADEQTAGRGRMQRRWQATAGRALLASIVLKGGSVATGPGTLPMIAGLATLRAVRECLMQGSLVRESTLPVAAGLKWPNDVLLARPGDSPCKVAGILIESSLQQEWLQHAVVGIGINANQSEDELPAVEPPALPPVSLALALGHPVDRTDLLIALCRAFAELLECPAPMLRAVWRQHLWNLGRPVTIHLGSQTLRGTALDVTDSGGLIVQNEADGRIQVVDAGDVSLWGAPVRRPGE